MAALPAANSQQLPCRWLPAEPSFYSSLGVVLYIEALRLAPMCALSVNAELSVNAGGAKGYACMLYKSRAAVCCCRAAQRGIVGVRKTVVGAGRACKAWGVPKNGGLGTRVALAEA